MTDTEKPAETTVPEEKKENVPENKGTTGAEKGPEKNTEKKNHRKELIIAVGVAVVLIIAALGAYSLLTPQIATKGDIVGVYYTGTLDNGTVFDSNVNASAPLVFTLGNSTIIPGFADAVSGMALNSEKTVTLPSEKAYGTYDPGLVQTINRTGPLENVTFVAGQAYIIHDRVTNSNSRITVVNVTPKTVTIDANNPLVGQNLTFTIKLVNITKVQNQ
ncbi:MAG: FKBP-type peptidyl-prolyl cis-trans isomerase [Methanoregula sp.]|nr:FKBP-type peptidyl-prolyl cis-trans isomerase [Methanoregula sp.]